MDKAFGTRVLPPDSPAIPLLEKNETGRGIYITHIDRSPLRTRILVFGAILLMHVVFSIIMVWRASKNYNVLLAFFLNDFYYVETGVSKKLKNGFWSWCWTFIVASFDYCLLRSFWSLVRKFITVHLWFRLRYGFHETEVVFRAPTGRKYVDMLQLPPATFERDWQMSLVQATGEPFILGNDGFTDCRPPWELCCTASMDAHQLAKDGVFDLKNWELSVWQKDEYQQWTVWEMWKHKDRSLNAMAVEIMKDKLKAQGKVAFVAKFEALQVQQASVASASLPDPAIGGLAQSIDTLFKAEGLDLGERWIEAITEADRIRNQPQVPQ